MRLCDMGVEPFLVSSTIEGVMAQRLVRRLCRDCRQSYRPTHDELPTDFPWDRFDTEAEHIFRARGCRKCRNTGYQGRLGIYELLVADEEIRNLANERTPSTLLKQRAIQNGMQSLRSDGWDKVLQGVTTVDEVLRVSKMD